MRVSDHSKVIVDMIACVLDSLICILVPPLSKNELFAISRPILHITAREKFIVCLAGVAMWPMEDLMTTVVHVHVHAGDQAPQSSLVVMYPLPMLGQERDEIKTLQIIVIIICNSMFYFPVFWTCRKRT